MLCTDIITIETGNGSREVLISPLLLQSKEPPDFKSGKISELFLYDKLWVDSYEAIVEKEMFVNEFKSKHYFIDNDTDIEKYYLGCLRIDVDSKLCLSWGDGSGNLTEQEVKVLFGSFFELKSRRILLLKKTPPSMFNFQ